MGEKTAISLLKKFGTIENLYKKLEKDKAKNIPEKLKNKLLENKNQAIFSKRLATIRYDVPIKFNLEDCLVENYSQEEVIKLFQKLNFRTLVNRLPSRQLTI